MVTKKKSVKKTVKNRIAKKVIVPKKSAHVKLWNQSKRSYQIDPEYMIQGGIEEQFSQGKKMVTIRGGEKCTITREHGEYLAKQYPNEIILLE